MPWCREGGPKPTRDRGPSQCWGPQPQPPICPLPSPPYLLGPPFRSQGVSTGRLHPSPRHPPLGTTPNQAEQRNPMRPRHNNDRPGKTRERKHVGEAAWQRQPSQRKAAASSEGGSWLSPARGPSLPSASHHSWLQQGSHGAYCIPSHHSTPPTKQGRNSPILTIGVSGKPHGRAT